MAGQRGRESGPRVTVSSGMLEGTEIGGAGAAGIERYLGIPYAAAPFGARRFDWPHLPEPWGGVRPCVSYGPTSPQLPFAEPLATVLPTPILAGDEILNLNIWTPARGRAGGPWPVVVWMHGGGLTRGGNSAPVYDGTAFARDGVVLVGVNYRLGAEGFSVLDDAPANLGLADQLAALRWVAREIAVFGGDPARVTVVGQSAGGTAIAALLASPEAAGLMRGAIMQSAPLGVVSRARGAATTRRVARRLGIAPTRAAFADVDPQELARAGKGVDLGEPGWWREPPMSYTPVIDGLLIPQDPRHALARGAGREVAVLAGYTAEEHRLWLAPGDFAARVTWPQVAALAALYRVPAATVRIYARAFAGLGPGETAGQLAQDLILRRPATLLAEARRRWGAPTWVYEFAWRSPYYGLGAAHAMDLPFVFDTLEAVTPASREGVDMVEAGEVAGAMHAAWVEFARSARADWPAWSGTGPVAVFGGPDGARTLARTASLTPML